MRAREVGLAYVNASLRCKTRALTMAELARRAGVSEGTVSRALADSPLIATKTR